jgi:Kef-type K+ transport system membrane component KefB
MLPLQLVVILLATRLCGAAARRVGQPRAVGEIAAGLALGPSLLGAAAPGVFAALFPPDQLAGLRALSEIGVVLFLFTVGLDLDAPAVRAHLRTAVWASAASIVLPFGLGLALAAGLPRTLAGPAGAPLPFALFVAAALSVTAFPVLATIVAERGLARTRLGTLAVAAAAADDVLAWCLLAAVLAVAGSGAGVAAFAATIGSAAVVVAAAVAARPLIARVVRRAGLAGALVIALLLAVATDRAGVHALFGAFLAGTLVPREGGTAGALAGRLADVVGVLLLPTFFAFTGLRTALDLTGDRALLWTFGALLAAAVVGKIGGTAAGARLAGEGWRDALALGALMNTRGLMALVVVTVGLDAGVIAPPLFGLMVLVALVTTAMTTPLLSLLGVARGDAPASTPTAPVDGRRQPGP